MIVQVKKRADGQIELTMLGAVILSRKESTGTLTPEQARTLAHSLLAILRRG